ncbi:MAG: hypothetical protein OXB88_08630 [Bacteriovoracales bacterium]|nr:hypothetical protein [Bacteriovoracales bacterium]
MNDRDQKAKLSASEKALKINLDHNIYGTFAEIGAGQEVARYFFQAGAAGGTVASTISAYDMAFSDHLYGKAARYVCQKRVEQMLLKEYRSLTTILQETRPKETKFFAYANTVSVRNFQGTNECHGWMGIRFQDKRHRENDANEIIIHVRLLDNDKISQSQAIGVCGVNLCYGAHFLSRDMDAFVVSLMDNLSHERIEIDMICVKGPLFAGVDNRILALKLVKNKMAHAVVFDEKGLVAQPSDLFYKKNIIVLRGSFRPPTHVNMDMIRCANEIYLQEEGHSEDNLLTITNITLANLRAGSGQGEIDDEDFLTRVDLLGGQGLKVLITNFTDYYRLNLYFERFKNQRVRFVLGIYNLMALLDESAYTDLSGGILEGMGRLFDRNSKLYVYPYREEDGHIHDCHHFEYPEHLKHLYFHLLNNGSIVPITNHDPNYLSIWSRNVLEMIQKGESGWEDQVPPSVAETVMEKSLFGYPKKRKSKKKK